MNETETKALLSDFAKDVKNGLSTKPKQLSSKYFYDARGDELFQQIMSLDEYYLTRAEFEILDGQKESILSSFLGNDKVFRLVELGAGDGTKTKLLLDAFVQSGVDFTYSPIDISENALNQLTIDLSQRLPQLKVEALQGDYFEALNELQEQKALKEVVLFLGSTIGNFGMEEGLSFLKKLGSKLRRGDLLFIGFDLQKDPEVILNAYNDKQGVTAEFNLNMLDRINEELSADFNKENFKHYPTYDPQSGEAKSFLISKKKQLVYIDALDKQFEFENGEVIFMEVSQKYSQEMINSYASNAGFRMVNQFFDDKKYFVDALWEKC